MAVAVLCAALAATLGAVLACNTMLVGRLATDTGSPYLAYNNEWDGFQRAFLAPLSMNSETLSFAQIRPRPVQRALALMVHDVTQGPCSVDEVIGGLNERGVTVDIGTQTILTPAAAAADPFLSGREMANLDPDAIEIVSEIAEADGFWEVLGGSMGIADSESAYGLYVLGRRTWVACRVPDDRALAISNLFLYSSFHADGKNCLAARHFEQWAADANVSARAGDDGTTRYDLRSAMPIAIQTMPSKITRLAQDHFWLTGEQRPLVRPSDGSVDLRGRVVTAAALAMAQRSTLDQIPMGKHLDISRTGPRHLPTEVGAPVCRAITNYGYVVQPGPELVGTVWLAIGSPCLSVHLPAWAGASIPDLLSNESEDLWSTMRRIQLDVDAAHTHDELAGCNGPVDLCDTDGVYYARVNGFVPSNGFTPNNSLGCGETCAAVAAFQAEQNYVSCAAKDMCTAEGAGPDCCLDIAPRCLDLSVRRRDRFLGARLRRVWAEEFVTTAFGRVQREVFHVAAEASSEARRLIDEDRAPEAARVLSSASRRASEMALEAAREVYYGLLRNQGRWREVSPESPSDDDVLAFVLGGGVAGLGATLLGLTTAAHYRSRRSGYTQL
eukprot:m51a1_g11288 hypothetical protein (612) ;mRNA; r:40303-42288